MRAPITLAAELHQEEPVPAPETKPAATALTTIAEPVIEGEVTIIEPESQPTPKHRTYSVLPLFTLLACLLSIGVPYIWHLLTPSATVTIIPHEEQIAITATIQIHGRLLPALTLSQSTTVPATGKRHQEAEQAHGYILLYNGSLAEQTIAAGTMLQGNDGIHIVTDQPASIPPASPPSEGQVSVPAHAVEIGASGNIPAGDISVALTSDVFAKNLPFRGGQDERTSTVVAKSDSATASSRLQATLLKSEQAALQIQVNPGEALLPPLCSETITADHQIGEEAREVTVTLSETCSSLAYPANALRHIAAQMLTTNAMQRLGTGYRLAGNVNISMLHTTITDQGQGIATLLVKLDAIYIYQLSEGEKLHLVHLIAGKSKESAVRMIVHLPGIQGAAITSNVGVLPNDPGNIVIVVERSVSRDL